MFRQGQIIFLQRLKSRVLCGALLVSAPVLIGAFCYAQSTATRPTYLAGSLERDEPQAVYAADAKDSWNRIFYCLFTRTIQTRLTSDFKDVAPFDAVEVMGLSHLTASTRVFTRIESGDRAIEPLYPSFFTRGGTSKGALPLFKEPRYSQLETALTEALKEKSQRSTLHRALMQSDAWAAYDILCRKYHFAGEEGELQRQRQHRLLYLLSRFIKKLALTSEEINALPDNYALAAPKHRLPDLFAKNSEWLEIQWGAEFIQHDQANDNRRATRVFIKPSAKPQDKKRFLTDLKLERLNQSKMLDAIALVIQNLLINSGGKVVPAPLTYEVQLRHFAKNEADKARAEVYEWSRELYLKQPQSGGLKRIGEDEPAYLPTAGNDLTFASAHSDGKGDEWPILAPLRSRCVSCHGEQLQIVMTLNRHSTVSPIRHFNARENDHSHYVAEQKMQREEFKTLLKQWANTH